MKHLVWVPFMGVYIPYKLQKNKFYSEWSLPWIGSAILQGASYGILAGYLMSLIVN